MKKVLILIAIYASLNLSCISTSEVNTEKLNVFPTVTGTDLHGEDRTLPDCLEKDYTIAVVAFKREQQTLCDGWYKHIEGELQNNENLAFFEVPTISEMNPFTRWFIHQGMKGGIKDPVMRGQVVTLHINKEPFKKALSIDTEETVHVYVLNKKGQILKHISGEWTEEKWSDLKRSIR
ncbi:MAG: hypothetical protein NE328_15205 [Lentisphaeraceae bacterium]|nr:hypothetical protein [Lentisphaeraceae bacterium]